MAIYSSPNAYTPLLSSRLYDADVVFASMDKRLNTPPRTRLFRPAGFDPEKWLFRRDLKNLPAAILADVYNQLVGDTRLTVLYGQSTAEDDPVENTIRISPKVAIKGLDGQTFRRTLTIAKDAP